MMLIRESDRRQNFPTIFNLSYERQVGNWFFVTYVIIYLYSPITDSLCCSTLPKISLANAFFPTQNGFESI